MSRGRSASGSEHPFETALVEAGGALVGRDRDGRLIVPAITLFALVPGIRSQVADGRDRLVDYLVANFGELVYV